MKFSRNKIQNVALISVGNKLYALGARVIKIVRYVAWIFSEKIYGIFRYACRDRKSLLVFVIISSLLLSGIIFTLAELGGYGQNGPATAPNSLNYGLVGYWDMEEGSGQTVYDKSGKGKNGTLGASSSIEASDPVFGPGHNSSGLVGTGMIFDGKDDYIDCGSDIDFGITNKFTLSAWVKPTGINPNPDSPEYGSSYVASFSDSSLRYQDSEFVFRATNIDDINADARSSAKELDHWYHIVGVYNGTDARLYIDGVSAADPVTLSGNVILGNPFRIGNFSGGIRYFQGSIDEVRVYNRVLSENEIRLLYNQKKPILEYKFDEGSGTVAHDASFNHYDAALGGDGLGTDLPSWVAGKSGTALSFDGIDDYINQTLPIDADGGTVSMWLKDPGVTGGEYIFSSDANVRTYFDIAYDTFIFAKGDPYTSIGTPVPIADTSGWHHYELTWHNMGGTFYASSYFDGIAQGSEVAFSDATEGTYFTLGGWGTTHEENAAGIVDNLRIYNYARTSDEVLTDYNDGIAARLGENNQDLNKGLVGYWDMEEGGGQTVYDKSGNGYDGILGASSTAEGNDPVFVSGRNSTGANGTGLKFDGINDYVNFNAIQKNSVYSISVWIDGLRTQSYGGIAHANGDSLSRWGLSLEGGDITSKNSNGVTSDFWHMEEYNETNFPAGWHLVTVTDDGTTRKYYKDGKFISQYTNVVTNSGVDITFWMGRGGSSSSNYFDGSIDELRIYNRVLSEDEIRQLYNQKKPILEYKFDEGSGTVAHDGSFNNNDATLGGGTADYMPTWITGKSGTALSFDGIDDYIDADNVNVAKSSQGSLSFWIKPTSFTAGGYTIFHIYENDITDYLRSYVYSDGTIDLVIEDNDVVQVGLRSTTPLAAGVWTHVSWVQDGAGIKLYLNGAPTVVTGTNSGSWWTSHLNSFFTKIGGPADPWGAFNGSLDNIRLYNYARTPDEVLADYNDGVAAHLGGNNQDLNKDLIGYWDMEEGSGQTVYDKSGNGNNGLFGISSSVEASDPVFGEGHDTHGKIGIGLVCDGIDDRVDLGTTTSLDMGTNDRTYNIWFKNNGAFVSPNRTILYSGAGSGTPASAGIWMAFNGTSSILIHFADGTTTRVAKTFSTGRSVFDNEWHNLTVIYDRDAGAYVYVDGVISPTSALDITTQQGYVDDKYAQRFCGVSGYAFKGIVDEARIYNRVLSVDEIRQLYNQKKPVLEMKFDEGAGTITYDESFNRNTGTINSATWTQGKFGNALQFDGNASVVNAGKNSSLDTGNVFTYSTWVKFDSLDYVNGTGNVYGLSGKGNPDQVASNAGWWIAYDNRNNSKSFKYICFGNSAGGYAGGGNNFNGYEYVFSPGIFYHLAVTIDSVAVARLYINGQQLGLPKTFYNLVLSDSSSDLLIGFNGAAHFNGTLDDIRVYQYARTASEVLTDYNNGLAAHLR